MPWCPNCKYEYQPENMTTCPDCGALAAKPKIWECAVISILSPMIWYAATRISLLPASDSAGLVLLWTSIALIIAPVIYGWLRQTILISDALKGWLIGSGILIMLEGMAAIAGFLEAWKILFIVPFTIGICAGSAMFGIITGSCLSRCLRKSL